MHKSIKVVHGESIHRFGVQDNTWASLSASIRMVFGDGPFDVRFKDEEVKPAHTNTLRLKTQVVLCSLVYQRIVIEIYTYPSIHSHT